MYQHSIGATRSVLFIVVVTIAVVCVSGGTLSWGVSVYVGDACRFDVGGIKSDVRRAHGVRHVSCGTLRGWCWRATCLAAVARAVDYVDVEN